MQPGFRNTILKLLRRTLREEGQDLVEYALILGMVSVAVVATMRGLGSQLVSYYNNEILAKFP